MLGFPFVPQQNYFQNVWQLLNITFTTHVRDKLMERKKKENKKLSHPICQFQSHEVDPPY